jgi:hypothetical protein
MLATRARLSLVALVGSAATFAACGTSFTPENLVNSVRLLAISADKPYAAPGDTVTLTALAYDGRSKKPLPMHVFWVPTVCPDPPGDSYSACYAGFPKAFAPGVDLTPELARYEDQPFAFKMPTDIITAHPPPASGSPYGMVVVFAIACAGNVQFVDRPQDTLPPLPPLGCFGDAGTELGPDDSVFAYAQIFSFLDGRTNLNPVISNLTFGAETVAAEDGGITVPACPKSGKCGFTLLDTKVPSSSWERDKADQIPGGPPVHEEIWVDYFSTSGSFNNDSVVLYDVTAGRLSTSPVQFTAPTATGSNVLWAVVRDNRGGVTWAQVALSVQ